MNSINNSIRSLYHVLPKPGFQPLINSTVSRRSLVYHSGSRARGLLRNPDDYLVSPSGRKYNEQSPEEAIAGLKGFLNHNSVSGIPNSLLLQVLTHKSFAHGKKPFNEKLSVFGNHLLKEVSATFVISNTVPAAAEAETGNTNAPITDGQIALIEGLNFDVLGTDFSRNMLHKSVIAEFARTHIPGIEKDVFWKKSNALIENPMYSGENVVLFDTLNAVIGAVNVVKGKQVATKFIEEAILSGEKSLIQLSKEYTKLLREARVNKTHYKDQ